MHSTSQNGHHLHYQRKRPIRSIRYYLFIKCYLMHSLSTPFFQTNSTLPDRSIIIHSIIIYFTATNTLPFISLLKLVFSRFTIFSLDYDRLIDMMSWRLKLLFFFYKNNIMHTKIIWLCLCGPKNNYIIPFNCYYIC